VLFAPSLAFFMHGHTTSRHAMDLNMGLGDILKKALANDESLGPAENPGLSKKVEPVEVEFLPSGKKVKAFPGQDLKLIARAAKVDIKYSCEKGECGTCTVNFNGKKVKTCVSSLPINSKTTKYTIGVLPPPQVPGKKKK